MRRLAPSFGVAAVLLAVALAAGGCRAARPPQGEPALTTDAGPFAWQVWLDPDPPRKSGTRLWLRVRDSAGQVVEGGRVELQYLMPAMGAMPEMRGKLEVAARGGGWYAAELDLPMDGSWKLAVAVQAGGALGEAEYTLTTGARGLRETGASAGGGGGAAAADAQVPLEVAPLALDAPVRETAETALAAYEAAHELLVAGRLDGLAGRARRLEDALEATREALRPEPGSGAERALVEGAGAARALAAAREVGAARGAFAELSRYLIPFVAADPTLSAGWQVFECPMIETFAKWIQRSPQLANPYTGEAMGGCGNPTDWSATAPVRSPDGTGVAAAAEVRIATGRRQEIGVVTERAERRALVVPVRAAGKVVFDETRLADVTVKYSGWIERLHVDEPGQLVRRGQPLFSLYSPELLAAQHEYLAALASQTEARATGAPDRADYLVAAARQKLRLWDLGAGQIERLERTRQPLASLPILSTVSGYVVEKAVVEGSAVEPGMRLFRLAGLDEVWVEAEVYESELPLLRVGDSALVTFPYLPGRSLAATIAFVYPYLDPATRTGRVRVELPNPGLELKPDMYANVTLDKALGERLAVPAEAVLHAGERQFVFVDLGEGRLAPRRVTLGQRAGDWVEVLAGLEEGEVIVTSGTFLVAAEARLDTPLEQWR
jgi:Cu(I)/Ag(I) efflux system membrane fusion protein